jgi:predicted DNA-binding ribbon-helix-helix protein
MESLVVKRSIILRGHKTSISVEEPFWKTLKDIAASRRVTRSQLITDIDAQRKAGNLSSAVRLFVLNQYYQPTAGRSHARYGASGFQDNY